MVPNIGVERRGSKRWQRWCSTKRTLLPLIAAATLVASCLAILEVRSWGSDAVHLEGQLGNEELSLSNPLGNSGAYPRADTPMPMGSIVPEDLEAYLTPVPPGVEEVGNGGDNGGDDAPEWEGKLVLLTSFPTSGNGFVRHFFTGCTGIDTLKPKGSTAVREFPWGPAFPDGNHPPKGKEPTLYKTHFPTTATEEGLDTVALGDHFGGIILLVRNPGDAITRNHLRWNRCRDTHDNLEERFKCYDEYAPSSCRIGPMPWVEHQEYWLKRIADTADVPHLIIKYEDAVERPGVVLGEMLDFVFKGTGLTYSRDRFLGQLEAQAQHVGSGDMGVFIGKCYESDRGRIVEPTKETFEKLGYQYAANSAAFTWGPSTG